MRAPNFLRNASPKKKRRLVWGCIVALLAPVALIMALTVFNIVSHTTVQVDFRPGSSPTPAASSTNNPYGIPQHTPATTVVNATYCPSSHDTAQSLTFVTDDGRQIILLTALGIAANNLGIVPGQHVALMLDRTSPPRIVGAIVLHMTSPTGCDPSIPGA